MESCSDIYDPNHPDADWSGFVPRTTCRKHNPAPAGQITTLNKHSVGPNDSASTAEWTKPARKIVPHRESGTVQLGNTWNHSHEEKEEDGERDEEDDVVNKSKGDDACNLKSSISSTFSLIGGPVPVNDPTSCSSSRWETEAQAAARRKRTDLQQLTDNGRSMHVRGRKRRSSIENGTDDERCNYDSEVNGNLSGNNNSDNNNEADSSSNETVNFAGFRINFHCGIQSPCFLKDIGKEVAKIPDLGDSKYVSTAPFAIDGNLPTDPYFKTNSKERQKDLLLENFSSSVPGYTGKRSFISY